MLDVDDDNIWRIDLFAILGVTEETSLKELRKVYKSLAKKYHPDRFPVNSAEQSEAKQKFSEISQAYEILSNEQKRSNYLDTRRLLMEHLEEEKQAQAAVEAASKAKANPKKASPKKAPKKAPASSPASKPKPKPEKPQEDYKTKEAEDLFKEGQKHMSKNDLDNAISSFQQALAILPDNAKFHAQLGRVYQLKGWSGMSQASYKKALVLNPNEPIAKKHYEPEKPKKKGFLDGLLSKFKK